MRLVPNRHCLAAFSLERTGEGGIDMDGML